MNFYVVHFGFTLPEESFPVKNLTSTSPPPEDVWTLTDSNSKLDDFRFAVFQPAFDVC